MQVRLCVALCTDISLIEAQYGELGEPYLRNGDDDENLADFYFGDEEEDPEDGEWLTYDEAVGFCGFCVGAIPDSTPWIMGNGEWAQSLIGVRDFSSYAMSIDDKAERLRVSEIYWDYRQKGKASAANKYPSG